MSVSRRQKEFLARNMPRGHLCLEHFQAQMVERIGMQQPQTHSAMTAPAGFRSNYDAHTSGAVPCIDFVQIKCTHGLIVVHEHQSRLACGPNVVLASSKRFHRGQAPGPHGRTHPPFVGTVFPCEQLIGVRRLHGPKSVVSFLQHREGKDSLDFSRDIHKDSIDIIAKLRPMLNKFNGRVVGALLVAFAMLWVQGCTINRDILFQTGDDYTFDELVASVDAEYRIAPNDFLSFQLFSNDGQRLLAVTAGSMEGANAANMNQMMQQQRNGGVQYLVQPDGRVKLPEIGWVEIEGLTLDEAEALVEEQYASLYNAPYAIIRVLNNRVLVFPGASGAAMVITLQNMNTTLLETLALAGGVSGRGDAAKVKLIRKTDEGNQIYFMDLSTIEGLTDAQTIVQANDIIYVEPVPEIAREVLNDISPVASIVSSLSVFWAVILSTNN